MKSLSFTAFAACVLLNPLTAVAAAPPEFVLARDGRAAVFVFAPGDSQWAAQRLIGRIDEWTGVKLPLRASTILPETELNLIAVGTPQSNVIVRTVLESDPRLEQAGEEGYILTAGTYDDKRVLVAAGATLAGVHNAVAELISWRLSLDGPNASVAGDIDESASPALKYRVLWNWTLGTHWPTRLADVYDPDPQNANHSPGYGQGEVGFLEHHQRAIDFFADHKLNGLILWHMLHDQHGGIDSARQLMVHGKRRNVRILPGIGTVIYNGFYSAGNSPYNMTTFLRDHPDVRRAINKNGSEAQLPCSIDPTYQAWLRKGSNWFFETFPEVGGANVEHGDFHACHCQHCLDQKARPENDPNCFWDMVTTQEPIFRHAQEVRPDAWMIFATYSGFTPEAFSRNFEEAASPPRFLDQYPANAICQWTLTGMITPETWPEGLGPPRGTVHEHIGYIHQGGLRNCCPGHPVDRARWWAGPSAIGDEISEVIQFVCGRVDSTGMQGLAMYGEIGAVAPAAELRYIALEYFSWFPDRSYEDFIRDRLSICYGSEELARKFLAMLRNVEKDGKQIEEHRRAAERLSNDRQLDVRQQQRWRNLQDELARRITLLESLPADSAGG